MKCVYLDQFVFQHLLSNEPEIRERCEWNVTRFGMQLGFWKELEQGDAEKAEQEGSEQRTIEECS